jgi:ribonuclease D
MTDTPAHAWIDRPEGLPEVAAALAGAPWVALDTESNSMFVYRERMCLLQLNAGGRLFVVDTLALGAPPADGPSTALDALKPELERADRPCWLHGGEYDVGVFRRDYGIRLGGIWDSQQAASMLGWERTGYGAVVEKLCGVTLDKAWTHYDWASRPLDPGALRYALDDVVYLPRVCEQLRTDVRAADLEEEVAIANQAVADATWSGGFDPAGFWRLKGVRELKPHQLGILAALWSWRDGIARAANQPPGRLLNNEAVLGVARSAPTNFQLLKKIGLRGWFLSSHGESLIGAIKAAQSDPPPLPARTRAREVAPAEVERETRLKDWRRGEAERRGVTLQVVLPARALEHLKQHGAADLGGVPQLGRKRAERYGERLQELCR